MRLPATGAAIRPRPAPSREFAQAVSPSQRPITLPGLLPGLRAPVVAKLNEDRPHVGVSEPKIAADLKILLARRPVVRQPQPAFCGLGT